MTRDTSLSDDDLLDKLFQYIFSVIQLNDSLSQADLTRIQKVYYGSKKYVVGNSNESNFACVSYSGENYGFFSTEDISQVVDFAPLYRSGNLYEIAPVMILKYNSSIYTQIHELCHLMSIGRYEQITKESIQHKFGICIYYYKIVDKSIVLDFSKDHEGLNELLNDVVCQFFFESITGQQKCKYDVVEAVGSLIYDEK